MPLPFHNFAVALIKIKILIHCYFLHHKCMTQNIGTNKVILNFHDILSKAVAPSVPLNTLHV